MRSPIKQKPLRFPGESNAEILSDQLESLIPWIFAPTVFILMAGLEWWRCFSPRDPVPIPMTVLAVVAVVLSVIKVRKTIKEAKSYKLGRAGEVAVGQLLEGLRRPSAYVLHDLIFDRFNIDHVIICRKGVFVIETKTWSKPDKGKAVIAFNGHSLKKNGQDVGSAALDQAERNAVDLANLIKERTGERPRAQPIVVFPGWYIESPDNGYKSGHTWVLNDTALPEYIKTLPTILTEDETRRYHVVLVDYARARAA